MGIRKIPPNTHNQNSKFQTPKGDKLQTTPISPPSGPVQRLFQEPPAKSNFLAVFPSSGTPPTQTQTVSTCARHGVPRKSSSMMAAPWFSKTPDAARRTPKTTAAKNLLGKAVWKATLTASEIDRQNHHRPRPHGSLLLFFFSDHCSLGTFHYFLPLFPPQPPFTPLRSPQRRPQAPHLKSKFLGASQSPERRGWRLLNRNHKPKGER
jgi:hypothetical protein